jgi:hypothetical protein
MTTAIYMDGGSGAPIYYFDGEFLYQGGMSGSPIATLKGNKIYPNYGASGSAIANIGGGRIYAGHFGATGPPLATVRGNQAYYDYGAGSPFLQADSADTDGLLVAAAMAHDQGLPGGAEKLPNEMYDRNGQYDTPLTARGDVFDARADTNMSDADYQAELRRRAGIGNGQSIGNKSDAICVGMGSRPRIDCGQGIIDINAAFDALHDDDDDDYEDEAPAPARTGALVRKKKKKSNFPYIPCEGWDENGKIEFEPRDEYPELKRLLETAWEDLSPRQRQVVHRTLDNIMHDPSLDPRISIRERRRLRYERDKKLREG